MKRSAALVPLSREHHEALVLARRAAAALDAESAARLVTQLLARWEAQFAPHFACEEQALLPALRAGGHEAAGVALAQHAELRRLVDRLRRGDLAALPAWGEAMQAHVRFEERTLFPLAESALDLSNLADSLARAAESHSIP